MSYKIICNALFSQVPGASSPLPLLHLLPTTKPREPLPPLLLLRPMAEDRRRGAVLGRRVCLPCVSKASVLLLNGGGLLLGGRDVGLGLRGDGGARVQRHVQEDKGVRTIKTKIKVVFPHIFFSTGAFGTLIWEAPAPASSCPPAGPWRPVARVGSPDWCRGPWGAGHKENNENARLTSTLRTSMNLNSDLGRTGLRMMMEMPDWSK